MHTNSSPRSATCRIRAWAAVLAVAALASPAHAQMISGDRIPGYAETFGVVLHERSYPYTAQLIECTAPGNVLWPGDTPSFTFQIVSHLDTPLAVQGKVDVIAYGTKGRPGDIWKPDMVKMANVDSISIPIDLAPQGYTNLTVTPKIPAQFGAYALVVDLGPQGRQFLTTCVRTFAADPQRLQYPRFCMDMLPVPLLRRLGVQAVRYGTGYVPTTHKDYAKFTAELEQRLRELQTNNITVLFMVGGGPASQPLGRPRPHLDDHDVMLDTKTDMAWLPENDDDFQQWVTRIAAEYGWPKGPINAFSLWNEPWEGLSISGWGGDMLRYRELYTRMARGVEQARKDAGVEVLIGGCDSSANTYDKLFGDGKDDFLKWLDMCTIHYQGMTSPCLDPQWINRKSPYGRVRIWDTESWVANTDDRVAAVVAVNRSAGYDRAMGVFQGNVGSEAKGQVIVNEGGKEKRVPVKVVNAWSVAASIGAAQHFLGERPFRELVFTNGLPWVVRFDGLPGANGQPNPEDGTLVVIGDIGEEFGAENLLFRTVRGLAEVAAKERLAQQLAALSADAPATNRAALEADLAQYQVLSGATMTLTAPDNAFALYDFYGNPVAAHDGQIVVPLNGRGFFLRTNGAAGSFEKLLAAVRAARIDGLEPLETIAHDLTAPIAAKPALRLTLTDMLTRPVTGTLTVKLGDLTLEPAAQTLTFAPHETKEIAIAVTGGKPVANNTYPLTLTFDAGKDGRAVHAEDLHVNVIAKRTITVDGKLDDWKDVLPQPVATVGTGGPTLTEAAWFPFVKYDESIKKGFANGYLAYDAHNFYFAAKIADDTPEDGMIRVETRDDDPFFYPPVVYQIDRDKTLQKKDVSWSAPDHEPFALLKPEGGPKDRVKMAWESVTKSFAVDLKLPADRLTQVTFHFLDQDWMERRNQRIEVIATETGKVLDKRDVKQFGRGTYAVYQLAGDVRVKFSANNFLAATLDGFFFDPVSGEAKVAGATAKFVKLDEAAEGNWKGVYGADGYQVIGTPEKFPAYVTVSLPDMVDKTELRWPEGVRRYSYRRRPDLPAGNAPNHDNVQIAFNAIPIGEDGMLACPPGTMPRYTGYKCTDYEYALNPIAPQYGGGTEIWRLLAPGMPRKQFYPREPRSPLDGPVKNGKLVVTRDGNTRIVECALPWSEIPDVKKRLDAGAPLKFSFRVNDNAGVGCLELAKGRSVSKRNAYAFHVDWTEHWANEVEFAWEK